MRLSVCTCTRVEYQVWVKLVGVELVGVTLVLFCGTVGNCFKVVSVLEL